jgi:hypothetical protein
MKEYALRAITVDIASCSVVDVQTTSSLYQKFMKLHRWGGFKVGNRNVKRERERERERNACR